MMNEGMNSGISTTVSIAIGLVSHVGHKK